MHSDLVCPTRRYGDYRNPNELGSGSGNEATYGTTGSSGGGLVRITATSAIIDGAIEAQGSGPVTDLSSGPAGGSGGGIYLQVISLAGSGFIRADGGKNGWGSQEGGAGGGGRVAIFYLTLSGFDLNHVSAVFWDNQPLFKICCWYRLSKTIEYAWFASPG